MRGRLTPATLVRLSEKTIELNFCAQLNEFLSRRLFWFGLTQLQEFNAGYDVFTRVGGVLLVLQFKASNYLLATGRRRFYAPHPQLSKLRTLGTRRPRSVFYVFPSLGSTMEMSASSDLIAQTQLLDAGSIPTTVGPPTKKDGNLRKNGVHYIDVGPGVATIHSEPTDVPLTSARAVLETRPRSILRRVVAPELRGDVRRDDDGDGAWLRDVRRAVSRSALGAILLPPVT